MPTKYLFLLFLFTQLNTTIMAQAQDIICDPKTGLCSLAPLPASTTTATPPLNEDTEIIYVGDPMCSWCWGISPALHQLEQQAMQEAGISFRILVGGLRPGGGDEWNEKFQNFLKHHWIEVNERSGQPFGYELFERTEFNYDTEPSCRAVVAARTMQPALEHRFFELVQHYFYVRNQDPNEVDFYQPICEELKLDFAQFSELFQSDAIRQATLAEFQLNRQWGVTGYPTVILRQGDQLTSLARGFATADQMWQRVEQLTKDN